MPPFDEFGRPSTDLHSFALSTARIGVWELDLGSHAARRSLLHDQIFGYPDLLPVWTYEIFLQHVVPEDRDEVDRKFRQALAVHGDWSFECRIARTDGEQRWIWGAGRHLPVEGGSGPRMAGIVQDITERKRTEQALRDSERRFRLALQNAPVSVAAQDRDLRFVWAYNQRTARPEDVIGRLDTDVFTAEDAARLVAIKRRVLEEEIEIREQMWLDRPGGRMFLDIYFEPSRDEAGRVTGVGTATVDLTPMKLAEEALRRNDDQFRALIENVNAGVALIDETGRFSLYNHQFLEIFGLAADSDIKNVNDQDWSAWLVFDENGELLDLDEHPVRKAALTRRAVRDRLVMVRLPHGGDPKWLLITAEPLFDANSRMERVICTYSDLTERKLAQDTLQTTLQRFYAVLSSMYPAILMVTNGGKVEFANPAFTDQFGLKDAPADLVGLTSEEILEKLKNAYLHPDEALARIREIVGRGKPVRGETLTMQDGRTCLRDFVPVNLDGNVYGRMWLHYDITQARLIEDALRLANAQLADADRNKNEFLAVLSHELRNPLAPIRNSLYILARAVPGGDQARKAQAIIERQVDQLARLVDDLLDVTRITRNKIQLRRHRLDLNGIARDTLDDYRSIFDSGGIGLTFEPAPEPVLVLGDPERLSQIVGNLLQNAAKFTGREGKTRVSIMIDRDAGRAVLRVADTGVGMGGDVLLRLFHPFVQADTTLNRSKGGLGLGLALVKGLVEMHGGDVTAHSDGPGRGSLFVVRLPLGLSEGETV
jgi:PAS domain S-box-containing protein